MPVIFVGLTILVLGAVGGGVFFLLSIPLPWILGSLFATGLASLCGVRIGRLRIGGEDMRLHPSWRNGAMVVIGMMLGAGFSPQIMVQMLGWWPSLLAMVVLSVLFLLVAASVLRRFAHMDGATAFMSGLPGGLSVVSSVADLYHVDARRVALSHTARLVSLLLLTPILLNTVSDYDLTEAARKQLSFAIHGDLIDLLALAALAVAAYFVAKMNRFPSGMFMVPLIFSAIAHGSGLIEAEVPGLISIAAQIVIGANVGVRFAGYHPLQIIKDGWLSVVIGSVLACLSLLAALVLDRITGIPVAPLFLSFLPGGAPELGTVALALHIDPALVASHHFLRVMLIVFALPLASRFFLRPAQGGR
jgi:membrane AbrB-like protein